MDAIEKREQYRYLRDNKPAMPRPGDSISAMGCTFKIKELLSSPECYLEWNEKHDSYEYHWTVEFLDPAGGYHRWKSYFDGGKINYA